ncbi:MAG: hypothetical protein NVSMB22_14140 [Chloroflexota bacterium]
MQALAVEARDSFGEDGLPAAGSGATSFDVVVDVYAEEGETAIAERVSSDACAALTRALAQDEEASAGLRHAVHAFVSHVLLFLRAQYPNADRVKQDRRLLSNLFWGHLVEARYAPRRPA